jgi:hypothetical protein
MFAARYRSIFAGVIMGSVSFFLTYHLRDLILMDPNVVIRGLKTAAFSLVVPGLVVGLVSGKVRAFAPSMIAIINFLFWFGFGWLLSTFITKLVNLRRAIAAAGVPSDRSSSLGSG